MFKTLNGRERNLSTARYRIDWDKAISGPQKAVKDFLRPYWENKLVLEEARIPNTRLRIDLMCPSEGLIVEVDGGQHESYNQFFHGSLAGYVKSIKSDLQKQQFADLNGYTLIRIKEDEIKRGLLSAEWIKETFGVTL